jgi:CubicO group peptidase (beta-lactamase class C family)
MRSARIVFVSIIILTTACLPLPVTAEDLAREVDKLVAKVAAADTPGCSVAIARSGEVIYKHAIGMADLEHNVALTTDSVFDIGSVSKEFTAASIVLLGQAGKLKLSDPLRKFIPELPATYGPITLDHLIHHTAGVPDVLGLWALQHDGLGQTHVSQNEADVHDGNGDFHYSTEDFLNMLSRVESLQFTPGEHFAYSNSNYMLLAIVVQRASGKSLREYAEENIFKPLGMSHTQFVDDHGLIVRDRAIGFVKNKSGAWFRDANVNDLVGDGGVYTTADDLLRWNRNFDTGQVGGPDFLKVMLLPVRLSSGKELGYGGGLFLQKYRGLPVVGHSGGSSAYQAEFLRFPDQGFAVAALCNTLANPSDLAYEIADLFLRAELRGQPERTRFRPPARIDVSSDTLSEYAGDYYSDQLGVTYRFIIEGNELKLFGRKSNEPFPQPIGKDQFFLRPGMRLEFTRDESGAVNGFTLASAFGANRLLDETYMPGPRLSFHRMSARGSTNATK